MKRADLAAWMWDEHKLKGVDYLGEKKAKLWYVYGKGAKAVYSVTSLNPNHPLLQDGPEEEDTQVVDADAQVDVEQEILKHLKEKGPLRRSDLSQFISQELKDNPSNFLGPAKAKLWYVYGTHKHSVYSSDELDEGHPMLNQVTELSETASTSGVRGNFVVGVSLESTKVSKGHDEVSMPQSLIDHLRITKELAKHERAIAESKNSKIINDYIREKIMKLDTVVTPEDIASFQSEAAGQNIGDTKMFDDIVSTLASVEDKLLKIYPELKPGPIPSPIPSSPAMKSILKRPRSDA
jgi:hypothetical protein